MASAFVSGPDRSWIPTHSQETDYFSHKKQIATVAERDRMNNSLPAGFPKTVVSPTAWTGADFENDPSRERYTLTLNQAQIMELEQACHNFEGLNLSLECVSQESFPLPTLGDELKTSATELTSGVGFFRIRGLDPQRYSNETNIVLYLGISSYSGKRGRQDELGNMLLHLTDLGSAAAPENERQAPYSNVGQPFHTDVGDIIALYSLGEAECGGASQLVSTATLFNELVTARPDIIRLLSSRSWIFDRFWSMATIHSPSDSIPHARRKGTSLFLQAPSRWERLFTPEPWYSRPKHLPCRSN